MLGHVRWLAPTAVVFVIVAVGWSLACSSDPDPQAQGYLSLSGDDGSGCSVCVESGPLNCGLLDCDEDGGDPCANAGGSCDNGTCACEAGSQCPGGYVCMSGYCAQELDGSCLDDSPTPFPWGDGGPAGGGCGTGSDCLSGNCLEGGVCSCCASPIVCDEAGDCACDSTVDCPFGVCDPSTGFCFDPNDAPWDFTDAYPAVDAEAGPPPEPVVDCNDCCAVVFTPKAAPQWCTDAGAIGGGPCTPGAPDIECVTSDSPTACTTSCCTCASSDAGPSVWVCSPHVSSACGGCPDQ